MACSLSARLETSQPQSDASSPTLTLPTQNYRAKEDLIKESASVGLHHLQTDLVLFLLLQDGLLLVGQTLELSLDGLWLGVLGLALLQQLLLLLLQQGQLRLGLLLQRLHADPQQGLLVLRPHLLLPHDVAHDVDGEAVEGVLPTKHGGQVVDPV